MATPVRYDIIIIGGGHAGAEAAWAAANMLREEAVGSGGRDGQVALVTMEPDKIGAMSCNPAIGGLAKGQMVREIDALGGLMGLAADATGIQFKVLNRSKGPAVRGPRCQSDKYAYAQEVQRLLQTRGNLTILAGTVEDFIIERGRCTGIIYMPNPAYVRLWRELEDDRGKAQMLGADCCAGEFFSGPHGTDGEVAPTRLNCAAVVLTTGTFMRGLMHTGEMKTKGGRVGEGPATTISDTLQRLGFELGRLKTGTPPRLDANTIDFDKTEPQPGDDVPEPFSDVSTIGDAALMVGGLDGCESGHIATINRFPVLKQVNCWVTHTHQAIHECIRANLDRAPMYNGQIETAGPRYCPSIEDKVVRFADKQAHHVFLEPESLRTDEIYCNGISTSLPADVQDVIVRGLPGCEQAKILRYGYAVEYDMVRPHQIDATCMAKHITGLFLAGQINGTSGYEEAAGQGLLAGVNAVRWHRGEPLLRLHRDQAYIGVLMDDLVTKTPREPYRMFTSRAEHRLLLRSDNAAERLTPLGRELGLVDDVRWSLYQQRRDAVAHLHAYCRGHRVDGQSMARWITRPNVGVKDVLNQLNGNPLPAAARTPRVISHLLAEAQYAGYIERQRKEVERLRSQEDVPLPVNLDFLTITGLRKEAALTLNHFQPATLGQAGRLAGVTPADLMVISMACR